MRTIAENSGGDCQTGHKFTSAFVAPGHNDDGDQLCLGGLAGPSDLVGVNPGLIKTGVAALTRDIMTIQADGDVAKARGLGERMGVIRPPVQTALDKLNDVPVDIEPRFVTADQLPAGK